MITIYCGNKHEEGDMYTIFSKKTNDELTEIIFDERNESVVREECYKKFKRMNNPSIEELISNYINNKTEEELRNIPEYMLQEVKDAAIRELEKRIHKI